MKVETVKTETRPDVVIRLSPTEADRLVGYLLTCTGRTIGDDGTPLTGRLMGFGYGGN